MCISCFGGRRMWECVCFDLHFLRKNNGNGVIKVNILRKQFKGQFFSGKPSNCPLSVLSLKEYVSVHLSYCNELHIRYNEPQ